MHSNLSSFLKSSWSLQVVALHEQWLEDPGGSDPRDSVTQQAPDVQDELHWVRENHRFNTQLWAEEDLARRQHVADRDIAANKRAIDRFNQARNDAVERLDESLIARLHLMTGEASTKTVDASESPPIRLHSETAGAMVDRLSILSLKIRAMRKQTQRDDVDSAHRQLCNSRLEKLLEQRQDLASSLDALLQDCIAGRAYFKIYRQFKMYNDPRFNPAMVAEQSQATRAREK